MRWAPSGPQPASVRKARRRVVRGRQPGHRAGEPVGDQGVGPRLEQPGAVPGAALVRVDGQVGELAGGDRVAVGVGGGTGHHEAGDQVALEARPAPGCGRRRAAQATRASRSAICVGVQGGEHLGGQQVGVRRAPGADLHGRDRRGVVGPGDPGGDVGAGHGSHPTIGSSADSVLGQRCDVRLLDVLEPGLGAAQHQGARPCSARSRRRRPATSPRGPRRRRRIPTTAGTTVSRSTSGAFTAVTAARRRAMEYSQNPSRP